RKGILLTMPKFYSEQFKRDAVALYENNENLSLAAVAAELGVNRASLHQWKRNSAPARRHAWLRLKPRQKLYLMQNAYVHWKKKTPNCVKSEIFCVRLRSILPKRHAGDPLPVCRRPPHRILGQADV